MPRRPSRSDQQFRYALSVQLGLIASLALLVALFTATLAPPERASAPPPPEVPGITQVEIPPTVERRTPPPPPQPLPPVPVDEPLSELDPVEFPDDIPELPETATEVPRLPDLPTYTVEEDEPEIFTIVENAPELIGGLEALQSRIRYPELARRANIQGTVIVQFVVDEQGRVLDPVCARDPGGGTCEAAIAAVRDSRFEPGRQRGRAVKVRYALPVRFRLR